MLFGRETYDSACYENEFETKHYRLLCHAYPTCYNLEIFNGLPVIIKDLSPVYVSSIPILSGSRATAL